MSWAEPQTLDEKKPAKFINGAGFGAFATDACCRNNLIITCKCAECKAEALVTPRKLTPPIFNSLHINVEQVSEIGVLPTEVR